MQDVNKPKAKSLRYSQIQKKTANMPQEITFSYLLVTPQEEKCYYVNTKFVNVLVSA